MATSHGDTGVTLRPYTRADAPTVVELINAAAAQTLGVRRAAVDGAGNIRLARYVPPSSEKIVAADAHNLPIGYVYLSPTERFILHETGGAVHPNYWGRGIGSALVQWAGRRAAILAEQAPAGVLALLQTNLFEVEQDALQLFADRGFERVREWVHMQVALDGSNPAPALAEPFHIRPMDLDRDWDEVGPVMDAAFADHWGSVALEDGAADEGDEDEDDDEDDDEPVDTSYSNAPGVCFVALDGPKIVGGILCNAKLVERDDTGRIGSMFVHPTHRRRGIGGALVLTAFQAFQQRGVRRIILDTDAQSFTAAPHFYARHGFRPYRREWLYETAIRPGREVRRLQS